MRLIIAGSRSIGDSDTVYSAVESGINEMGISVSEVSMVVSGGASGVDTLGEKWAYENGVPLRAFDVSSEMVEEYGNYAFKLRNEAMAEYADALIAVWDNSSSGTKHMIDEADENNLELYVENTGSTTLGDFT